MKRALWAVPMLALVCVWFARGAYSYYYTENGASPNWSNWIVENNGGALGAYSSGGLSGIAFNNYTPASGRMTYPSTSGSPGEMKLTLRMPTPLVGTGNAIVYLSASTDLSAPGASPVSGSGYRIYFQYTSTGSWYWLSKIINGEFNIVAWGFAGPGHDLMTLRFVKNSGLVIGYLDNVRFLYYYDSSYNSGRMAVELTRSTDDVAPGPLLSQIDLGNLDSTPPNAIPSGSVSVTPFYNHVDIQWPVATDDTNGSGVYGYDLVRDGWAIASTTGTSFSDATVLPNTTYAYTLAVRDFHGNYTSTYFNVTTPPVAPEGRRVGVRTTGAYWGAGGENIDVLSGNLNFTLPLLNAQSRSGWGVGFKLNYNSQNWRYDSNTTWKYGGDVGYGFGWRLMAGSITPVLSNAYTINYYLFTDSTGAEYRLDQNSSNVWSSKESTYVYFDANYNRLNFTNGTWWNFGCTSAAGEADSGVMYPTLMQDSNGNEVIVSYQTGAGASWTNSSARITTIEDVRAYQINPPATYTFTYNTDSPPHLTSIANYINTGENYSFSYSTGQALSSPFGSTSFGTTAMLQKVTITGSTDHEFTYNGSGELTQVLLPYKGYLAYDYTTTTYSNGHSYREVVHRYLSKDGISSTQYPFSHEASPGAIHQFTQLDDPGGAGSKHWTFATSGLAMGLVTQYQGLQQPGAVPLIQNDYTWNQDTVGNNYVGSVTTTADPTQSYAAAKKTDQTLDIYGNVTQVKTYDYGNLTTPIRTDNYTYLSYPWYYLFNRLTSSPTTTIAYDQFSTTSAPGDVHEWSSLLNGGNPTTITSPAGTQILHYDFAGSVISNTVNGLSSSITSTNATNYAAPSQITVGSLSNSMSYSTFLGLTNETDPNGASSTIGYDAMARPTSTTSPFGANTATSYYDTASPPYVQTTVNGRWTRTTMDGLGRTIKTEAGNGSGTLSVAETVYDSCGCSPTGKMTQTALPHALGATPVWTTYTYDGIGRTLTASTAGTDTTGTTNYVYQGNTVKVTDAAGKWKKYTMNALGQLVQVNEPNPGNSDYVTNYTYDTLGHLTGVSMPRPGGTQTRSFNYGNPPGALLLSSTNPENGTVTYTYNSDNTLATKTDAKNQQVQYSYDSYRRVTQIRRGTYNGTFTEDTCQQENYYYDTAQNGLGRLASVQYQGGRGFYLSGPSCDHTFSESFAYSSAGGIASQSFGVSEPARNYSGGGTVATGLTASYTYDNEGRVTATQYPSSWNGYSWVAGPNIGNTFDSMGRLQKITDLGASSDIISNATYGPAGQLLTMTAGPLGISETRSYNSIGQLTSISSCVNSYGTCTPTLNAQYNYPATQNNGKIASQTDGISGEQIVYTYDSLNRLASATGYGWGQSYNYDGFGNLTDQNVTSGTAPALHVTYDPATNRQTGGECADANGNLNAVSGTYPCWSGYSYDIENRIVMQTAWGSASPTVAYSYKPGNKRIWKGTGYVYDGQNSLPANEELTFWSITGQKLQTYSLTQYQPGGPGTQPQLVAAQTATNYYFGGRLIKNTTGYVTPDRLGSIGKYFPYGQERPSATTNGTEKFGTYFRDSDTGLDYADQRYHQPGMGRFMTPDPYGGSSHTKNPGSLNKYAYTGGDPVNNSDPSGLDSGLGIIVGPIPGSGWVPPDSFLPDPVACSEFAIMAPWAVAYLSSIGDCGGEQAGGTLGGGTMPTPPPPCGADNPGLVTPTAEQKSLLGSQSWSGLTADQQLVFLTVTADAAALDINLAGLSLTSITIGGSARTELNLSGDPAVVTALTNALNGDPIFSHYAGGLSRITVGTPHAGFDSNFRQNVSTYSMQINTSAAGNVQIDIDPNNPNSRRFALHWLNAATGLTGSDTNYHGVATALSGRGINSFSGCP